MHPIIVIGSGLAGFSLARELRKHDAAVPIRMLTLDDGGFYSKPLLSNALAAGKTAQQLANKTAAQMTLELGVEIMPHTRVDAIDSAGRWVSANGASIGYSALVLALGASPVRPPLGGDAAGEVLSVNDLADYARFRRLLEGKQRVAILGAGLIGCEFANDLLLAGYGVDIIAPDQLPLATLLPPQAGRPLQQALDALGARWHLGATADAVDRTQNGYRLTLSDGSHIESDLVLSAIGLRANTGLAAAAGIAVRRGIVVDNRLQTSAAGVYAVGDCAEAQGKVLSYVMPLMQQVRVLAKVLAGSEAELNYPVMPVVVKTPTCPIVACPPDRGLAGTWCVEQSTDGVRACFYDGDQRLRGFALTHRATNEKNALAQQLAS